MSLALQLAVSLTLSQTAFLGTADPSRGATLLPGSVALADEPTALVYNPGALRGQQGPSLIYQHELSNSRRLDVDSVFVGTSLGKVIGLGLGFESIRPWGGPHRGRFSFGGAFGTEHLSVGLVVNAFNFGPTHGLASFDLGVQSRPFRWLSMGALVRNLNTPSNAATALEREYVLGIGARPFNEHVSLGVDWVLSERLPLDQSRLQYTLQLTPRAVLSGIRVLLGVSHSFTPGGGVTLQAGLGADLEHFGYTQGVSAVRPGAVDWHFMARASAENYPSVVQTKRVAVLSLDGLGAPSPTSTLGSLLGVVREDRFLRVLRLLNRAAEDAALAGVVVKLEGSNLGLARADELRSAIVKLRSAGKTVVAYALSVGDPEYLVASACDAIYAAPGAMMMVDGVKSTVMHFGGTAELLGIDVDVARVGAYKSFPEQFTRKDMSPEHRETVNAYLDTMARTLERRMMEGRRLSPEQWQTIVDEGLKSVQRAKELKQIDDVVTPQQFDEALAKLIPGGQLDKDYQPFDVRDVRWGQAPRIAVVPVLGSISGGQNQNTPFAQVAGAQSFMESLNNAVNDPSVKAIVVRIDSGGGDALASDLMYRAVVQAKKQKPVIASMGDVAASGGYYIAMGADRVFASPTTLTGSIGIFFAKPAVKRLAEKLGITQQTISRGKLSGITDVVEPWSEEQKAAAQRWVESGYDTFITEVAASRKMTKDAVDAVARGRVWSGADAQTHGLVDELGGLMDAVAAARKASGAGPELEVHMYQSQGGVMGSVLSATAPAILELPVSAALSPFSIEAFAAKLGLFGWLLEPPALQARMEYVIEAR